MSPTSWTIIISGVTTAGAVLGTMLARMGKKGDQAQQLVSDQFRRMLDENSYLATSLAAARAETEARLSRQADRCRRIMDAATRTIVDLISGRVNAEEAHRTLLDIAEHGEQDHPVS